MKNIHQERLSRLTSTIAEIHVGGYSEVERGEERDLIIDSLNSAKSAIKGGVLPGGGVALFHASKVLESELINDLEDPSERVGAKILLEALKVPIQKLIQNKTGSSGAHIIGKIEEAGDFFTGYDL